MADPIELLTALEDVAGHLDWPDRSVDVTSRAVAELGAGPQPTAPPAPVQKWGPRRRADRHLPPRWARAAIAATAAAVLVLTVLPPTRRAVADLLGVGGIQITQTSDAPRHLDGRLDLGRPVTLAQAQGLAPGPLPQPATLSAPTAMFAGEPPGGVTMVWAPNEALPEVLDYDIGLLITMFPGSLDEPERIIGKRTTAGGTVQLTNVNGEPAFWLAGEPHEISYIDQQGHTRQDTIRLSGDALVWADDDVTYRLESALSLSDARRLAETLPA